MPRRTKRIRKVLRGYVVHAIGKIGSGAGIPGHHGGIWDETQIGVAVRTAVQDLNTDFPLMGRRRFTIESEGYDLKMEERPDKKKCLISFVYRDHVMTRDGDPGKIFFNTVIDGFW